MKVDNKKAGIGMMLFGLVLYAYSNKYKEDRSKITLQEQSLAPSFNFLSGAFIVAGLLVAIKK
jgi:hypothetical protein